LLEAAVSWAEAHDVRHLAATTSAHSRDANRFMARLGLARVAVIRGASVQALRARLPGEAPSLAGVAGRPQHLGQLLAQRRSLRRAQLDSAPSVGGRDER
jgi:hypothetical protein